MKSIELKNDSLSFSTYMDGAGPLAICLHGFPDSALTFRHQIQALADAGYRVVAPTMRGYEPSSQPNDGDYSVVALVSDVLAWMDDLGEDKAHLIGHDWGASVSYFAAAIAPERFNSITAMAVPHPIGIPKAIRKVPRQILRSWYMSFFQLRGISERITRRDDWALIKKLWCDWSPDFELSETEWSELRKVFEDDGVLSAMLGYYRHNARPTQLLGLRLSEMEPIATVPVPTLAITGANDGCIDTNLFDYAFNQDYFPKELRIERIQNAGHFLHRERPDVVNEMIIGWLNSHDNDW